MVIWSCKHTHFNNIFYGLILNIYIVLIFITIILVLYITDNNISFKIKLYKVELIIFEHLLVIISVSLVTNITLSKVR